MILRAVSYTHLDVYKRQMYLLYDTQWAQLDDAVFFEDLTRWMEADSTKPLERKMCIRDRCSHVIQTKQEYETLLDQRDRARREKEEAARAAAREISRVTPVSYTHLDVYKRQE